MLFHSVSRPLQILILTTAYPTPASPVAGVFVRDQARALTAKCEVRVVHLDRGRGIPRPHRVTTDDGVQTWRVPLPLSPRPLSLAGLFVAGATGWRAATRDGFSPDVIHAHFFLAGLPAILLGTTHRRPVAVTEHWGIFLPEDPAVLRTPLRLAAKAALERADVVIPVSRALERGIAAHGIRARTRVIPNLVDLSTFHPPEPRPPHDPPRLLSVGLLYDAKGIDLLLDAAAILEASGHRFHLDVVGDGELRGPLEAQSAQLGLGDSVRLLGVREKDQVAALMRDADVFVLPSRYDNNPVALIEALASGLPAVATDVGGVRDILAGEGVLTTPDPGGIAEAIRATLARLGEQERSTIAAHAAARFGADIVVGELLDLYEELTNDRKSNRHASG
jgi:glycosyltransferase involved in cell wall biosynthesis